MKYRLNSALISVLFFWPLLLSGQNIQDLYKLYSAKKIDELRIELDKIEVETSQNPHIIFLNTVLIEDGDAAAKIYESMVDKTDGILNRHLIEKLSEYYYARGFYVKAQSWRSRIIQSEKTKEISVSDKPYIIQVGAFGFEDNAIKLQKLLASNQIDSEIVKRKLSEKDLYCVWIEGETSRDETERIAKKIESQLRLNYRIIQP
jgi:hypothetical protein